MIGIFRIFIALVLKRKLIEGKVGVCGHGDSLEAFYSEYSKESSLIKSHL